jgi:predicted GNAT family N-acyltransferase
MLTVKVVENEEERLKAFVVRAIVYIHEQSCPYDEEFDLNDFTATQIVGLVNGEPVLTARIRYFGKLAKLERLAIRPEYRGKGYGHQLLQYMLWLCQSKGFNSFYLHAQSRLEPFYNQYGFKRDGENFAFSDHEYIGMRAELPSLEDRGGLRADDPMVINRPEGRWSVPGPIEKSLERLAAPAAPEFAAPVPAPVEPAAPWAAGFA